MQELLSQSLIKGQKLNVENNFKDDLFSIVFNWETNLNASDDVEACAILLSENDFLENDENLIFKYQPNSSSGSVSISKKETENKAVFDINLNNIPENVNKIIFILSLKDYDNSFKYISSTIFNKDVKLAFKMEELTKEKSLLFLRIYKYNNSWKIFCIGEGFTSLFSETLKNYGINYPHIIARSKAEYEFAKNNPKVEIKQEEISKEVEENNKETKQIIESLEELSEKIKQEKGSIESEEETKMAFILPFFQILGYNFLNTKEVKPEFNADVANKKGEKIDYAIMKDEKPIILVECKTCHDNLSNPNNLAQLERYFQCVLETKFGVLTNGVVYKFFTDLDNKNIMDKNPFFEFDVTNFKESEVNQLKKFHKSSFNIDNVWDSVGELKLTKQIKAKLEKEFKEPSSEFIKFIATEFHNGRFTDKQVEKFRPVVKKSLSQLINEIISQKLEALQKINVETINSESEDINEATVEEIRCFHIVQSILGNYIDIDRIMCKSYKGHFAIFIDDRKRDIVCKLYFNENKKEVEICNIENFKTINLINFSELYKYKEEFKQSLNKLIKK